MKKEEVAFRRARGRGCITSTPKSGDFSDFWPKTPKNERGFCIPRPKNAERPYLASRKPSLLDPIFGLRNLVSTAGRTPTTIQPYTTQRDVKLSDSRCTFSYFFNSTTNTVSWTLLTTLYTIHPNKPLINNKNVFVNES